MMTRDARVIEVRVKEVLIEFSSNHRICLIQAPVADDIYDDVITEQQQRPTAPTPLQPHPIGRPPIQPPLTPTPQPKFNHAPIKTEKDFEKLPAEKFQVKRQFKIVQF